MNLNYDEGLNFDNIAPEVKTWYAFPEDKKLIHRYLNHEFLFSKASQDANTARAKYETFLIFSTLIGGTVGYCYLLAPSGKVIRDKIDASMSRSRYWARRLMPFIGLAVPFYLVRRSVQVDNGYRN